MVLNRLLWQALRKRGFYVLFGNGKFHCGRGIAGRRCANSTSNHVGR